MAKKSAYKPPKMMVNGNGWHEGARSEQEEKELLAKGFKHLQPSVTEDQEESAE